MRRRNFIRSLSIGSGAIVATPAISIPAVANTISKTRTAKELPADVIIAGAGMGGCAAAIAALRNGLRVVMTEETDWIGG